MNLNRKNVQLKNEFKLDFFLIKNFFIELFFVMDLEKQMKHRKFLRVLVQLSEIFDLGDTASDRALASSSHPSPHFLRLHQILGSVCYGYGCFHLLLSLLPGHQLKWLKFLGFDGDLQVGIRALTYCMNSPDSKSLLARYEF